MWARRTGRIAAAIAVSLALAVAGCGSNETTPADPQSPGALNASDDSVVGESVELVERSARRLEDPATGTLTDPDFAGGLAPDERAQARESLRLGVTAVISALEEERPDTMIASQDGATVRVVLTRLAELAAGPEPSLARKLRRTRQALSPTADGGASAASPSELELEARRGDPTLLDQVSDRLQAESYIVRENSRLEGAPRPLAGLDVNFEDLRGLILLYPTEAAAERERKRLTSGGGEIEVRALRRGPRLYLSTSGGAAALKRMARIAEGG
ncbi:MAG: hypothetical protein ACR2NA_08320 [Solirubrobacterales bacterium]